MANKIIASLICMIMIVFLPQYEIGAETDKPEYDVIYDTLLSTLSPYISQAVTEYYGEHKQYGLYDAKILNIERPHEGGFTFKVTVQVTTFEHAHNPPYGTETITMKVGASGVEVINFHHEGDKWEKKKNQFYQKVLTEIKKAFQLDLGKYRKYTSGQVTYRAEHDESFQSLDNIIGDIIKIVLNPEVGRPYKNVIDPVTYINKRTGYILFKRADGTNVMYIIKKQEGQWITVEKKRKPGKKMDKFLMWYM